MKGSLEGSGKFEPLTDTADICRDYLRNICNRDKRCKFRHLTAEDLELMVDTRKDPASVNVVYEFCHDYQNNACDRQFCKFIHCSESTETRYLNSGYLPLKCKYDFELGVQDVAMFVILANADAVQAASGQEPLKPICRDFIQRHCRRGKKCRFTHLDQNKSITRQKGRRQGPNAEQGLKNNCINLDQKRLRILPLEHANGGASDHEPSNGLIHHVAPQRDISSLQYMKEENLMLRNELAELRKQVSGLSATNEVLLEQNAQFRLQKRCLVEGGTVTFSQGKPFSAQAPLSLSVPIAMSLRVSGQGQQLTESRGIAGTSLLSSEALTVTPMGLSTQNSLTTVNVMPHVSIPAHIQLSTSIPQNTPGIVSNIATHDSQLLNGIQTLTTHQVSVGTSPDQLHANIGPVLQQANIVGQNVANYSISQNTTNSLSGTTIMHSSQLPLVSRSTVAGHAAININQPPPPQNLNAAGGMFQQAGGNIVIQADEKPLSHLNHNFAAGHVAHPTMMTANQQNQSSGGHVTGNLPGFAAQVIAARGSLAHNNSEVGTAQISVPTIPCGSLAPAIVPVTIATTMPVSAIVPTMSLNNTQSIIANQLGGIGSSQGLACMRTSQGLISRSCPATIVTFSLPQPGPQVVNASSGRHVVGGQQQLNTPMNYALNQVPAQTVQPPPGPSGLHS